MFGRERTPPPKRPHPAVCEVTWLSGRCASSCLGPGLVRDPCRRAVPGNPVSDRHWGKRRRSSRGIPPAGQRVPVRFEAGRHSRDPCHRVPDLAPGFGRRPTPLRTVPQRPTIRSVWGSLIIFMLFLFSSGAGFAPCFNTDNNLLFWRPQVFSAARVRENRLPSHSLRPHPANPGMGFWQAGQRSGSTCQTRRMRSRQRLEGVKVLAPRQLREQVRERLRQALLGFPFLRYFSKPLSPVSRVGGPPPSLGISSSASCRLFCRFIRRIPLDASWTGW